MFFGLVLRFFEDPTTLFRWLIRQNSRPFFLLWTFLMRKKSNKSFSSFVGTISEMRQKTRYEEKKFHQQNGFGRSERQFRKIITYQ